MANLTPVPGWDDVFQLETTTPVLGGPGGVSNQQAQNLLNRLALIDSATGSSRVGFKRTEAGTVARTTQDKLSERPSVKDFSAVGNNIAADQAAFVAAALVASHVEVPAGIYRFTANTTVNCALSLFRGAILAPDVGVTITLVNAFMADRTKHIQGAGTVVFGPGSVDNVAAEWFGLSPTETEANNTAAIQKAWVAGFGTYVSVGRGAFPLGDTEVKAIALTNTSQLPNGFIGSGVDGNGGGGGVSTNVGTSFYGNAARIHFNNDASFNSDAKIKIAGFHIVGPNDNTIGMGGIKVTKMSNFVLENTQVTGSRGHGYELIKCYGAVVQKNTALSNRQYGFLCNQQFNQACLRDNKSIGNGKDYTGIYANIAFSGGAGLESLGAVVENNDVSYGGANAVLYKRTNPSPSANSITISSLVVSGGIATVTTAAVHGRANGDYISVYGVTSDPNLNTIFTPQITVTGTSTFTFPTIAPNGSYTDATMVIGPAAYGAIYNDMRGAIITHYGEDSIGVSAYVGSNTMASRFSGGYNQGFNTAGGGNGVILFDDCTNVSVSALSLSGANSLLVVNASNRKHGINIASTVMVENSAQIRYASIQMRDGEYYSTAAPTGGTWLQGDWVHNLNAAPGQPQFWYCSAAPLTFTAIDGAAGGGSSLPPQAGNAGKVLGTDGTVTSWVAQAGALPSQAGNAGRYLGTDGTNLSWNVVSGGTLPAQTGNAGKILTTDGTNASWFTPVGLASITPNMGAITGGSIATAGNISAGNFSTTGTTTTTNLNVVTSFSAPNANITGNATITGTLTGNIANFSGNVSAAGHIGGAHTGTSGNFTSGFTIAGGLVVSSGGASISGSTTIAATAGTSLTCPAPSSGTGLRCTSAGGGSTALTVDGSSGGVAAYIIGSMRLDSGFSAGSGATAGTASLLNKPGTSGEGLWVPINMNGVLCDMLVWPR